MTSSAIGKGFGGRIKAELEFWAQSLAPGFPGDKTIKRKGGENRLTNEAEKLVPEAIPIERSICLKK